jgi:hypothetical protein
MKLDTVDYAIISAVAICVIIALVLIFNAPTIEGETRETESGMKYELFYIEGMPCVYVRDGALNSSTGGPSCDWSKWKGR